MNPAYIAGIATGIAATLVMSALAAFTLSRALRGDGESLTEDEAAALYGPLRDDSFPATENDSDNRHNS